ncbi:MAG: alpha/beta fold hydrolase [Phycisphaerales bacterium]|nr:alpha/beta fold hydrolase [Phycisphaerales bacterium]
MMISNRSRYVSTLLVSILVVGVNATARAQDAPAPAPTFDERLEIANITDNILRGKPPEVADYATLAKDKGVKRIICLLKQDEVSAEQQDAAKKAGIEYIFRPIMAVESDKQEERRIDRPAVKAIVETLRNPGDGVTYIHCDNGRDRTGVVHFAYLVLVDKLDYGFAVLEIARRGFNASGHQGFQEDLKLLASGLDALPVLQVMPISDLQLTSRGKRMAVPGVRLNVKESGKGSAVYTLHGGPGETHMTLRPYLDDFANDHDLVYFDQRGCGLSSRPQFSEAYSIERLVEDLENLRKALGHEKISLIAHSSGGAVAARYALEHREHVDKLVIVSSWASSDMITKTSVLGLVLMSHKDQDALADVLRKLREEQRDFNDEELGEMQKSFYPAQFFGKMTPEFREDWNRRAKLSALAYHALSTEYFGKTTDPQHLDLRPQLAQLAGVPTLVIAGRFDIVTPPGTVKAYADGIPGARFEVFEKSGHHPFVEENERFVKLVREFLDGK